MRLLKRFSLNLQPGTNISDYVNTKEMLQFVLPKLSVSGTSTAASVQYWFRDYFEYLNTSPYRGPENR